MMTLIEKIMVDNNSISFYEGIDFTFLKNHPKDGSNGFIFCFVDNFIKELKSYQRQSKIDSVLSDDEILNFDTKDIDNSYVAIYQLEGTEPGVLFKIIKEKVVNKKFAEHPWIPISGLNKGAWKISISNIPN